MYLIDSIPQLNIGRLGENDATSIEIDASAWIADYPGMTFEITLLAPGGSAPFLVTGVSETGGIVTWLVKSDALQVAGAGSVVIRGSLAGVEKRSAKADVIIEAGHQTAGDPPAEYADWIAQALDAKAALVIPYIKYSAIVPTQNSEMTDTPDNYVGICVAPPDAPPTSYTQYTWYKWVGPSYTILGPAYATLTALRTAVPSPHPGDLYNVGSAPPYHVYRATGLANPADWEDQGTISALPVINGSTTCTLVGLLKSNGANVLVATAGTDYATGAQGTKADDAATAIVTINGNIATINSTLAAKANKAVVYTATLLSANWSASAPYTQTVTLSGALSTDNPIVDVVLSATLATAIAQLEAYSYIGKIVSNAGSITATCLETKPTVNIPLKLMVIR